MADPNNPESSGNPEIPPERGARYVRGRGLPAVAHGRRALNQPTPPPAPPPEQPPREPSPPWTTVASGRNRPKEGDWRAARPPPTGGGPRDGIKARGHNLIPHPRIKFQPGMIFAAPMHVSDNMQGATANTDDAILQTVYGYVYTKMRKFVIIRTWSDICIILPVATRSGRGLADLRDPELIAQHIAIREAGQNPTEASEIRKAAAADAPVSPKAAEIDTGNGEILSRRLDEFKHHTSGFHLMSPTSYVRVTEAYTFRYTLPCQFEASIDRENMNRLIDLYNRHHPPVPRIE